MVPHSERKKSGSLADEESGHYEYLSIAREGRMPTTPGGDPPREN
jgi:hypothetical protein